MDALIKALGDKGIKTESTARFFFTSFPFRVTLDAESFAQANTPRSRKISSALLRWRTAGKSFIDRIDPSGDVKVRHQGGFVSIYFTDPVDVLRTVDRLGDYVVGVAAPSGDREFAAMSADTRVEIRDALYWGKYRWVATFKTITPEQATEVSEWLCNFREMNEGQDKTFISFSSPPRAYFLDENDLFYFRIVFYERIARIEKALLKKEIADEYVASEGFH